MSASVILGIISALFTLARAFVGYAQQQRWIDEGTAAVVLKATQDSDDAIARANHARELVRSNSDRDPSSILRDDDGYRRADD